MDSGERFHREADYRDVYDQIIKILSTTTVGVTDLAGGFLCRRVSVVQVIYKIHGPSSCEVV